MTLTLSLTSPLEDRVKDEARRHGVSVNDYVTDVLARQLASPDRRQEIVGLLQSWIDDDEGADQQRETGRYLVQALDEDRPSDRKLFPPELKDVTW